MNKKHCTRCGIKKPLSEFYFQKTRNRYRSTCKECTLAANRQRWTSYYENNREDLLSNSRAYHSEHREEILKRKKKDYRKDLTVSREKSRIKSQRNRKKINDYITERLRTDINFRIAKNLRNRINQIMRKGRGMKAGSAVLDLGCSLSEFRLHLENQFQSDMSWENYGEWHIDHIIPLSGFDLTERAQFLKACHYANLQPLWSSDNQSKGGR